MDERAGAQIGQRAFIQSLLILLALMVAAGATTYLVPSGSYARTIQDGREYITAGSFQYTARPDYPVWRWLTAPIEVLTGPDNLIIITIIIFLLFIAIAFAVLEKAGILNMALAGTIRVFGGKKYLLLLVISFLFMALGAFFGLFEEVVPLVPLMIALAYYLGWDALTGLGMSILATNLGFSAAISNPFTIGVAQRLAGLPLFSGAGLRFIIFAAIYIVLAVFLTRYARSIEREPGRSPVYEEDQAGRKKYANLRLEVDAHENARLRKATRWLFFCLALILLVLVSTPLLAGLSDFSLPLVGLLFLVGGVGAGLLAGLRGKALSGTIIQGISGILLAIPLILMAASVKHIVVQGGVMDTVIYQASLSFSQTGAYLGSLLVYGLALFLEFFISSGSAKAFLLMPVLLPLADLVGVTRQVAVTAYCFGDGFSNLAYPTNPVLLVSLGLASVSYPKWIKWTLGLWGWIFLVTLAFLALAVAIGYGQ